MLERLVFWMGSADSGVIQRQEGKQEGPISKLCTKFQRGEQQWPTSYRVGEPGDNRLPGDDNTSWGSKGEAE